MRAVEDHHVDRPGVEAQQCVKLTGTNRSIGLLTFPFLRKGEPSHAAASPIRDVRHPRHGRGQKRSRKDTIPWFPVRNPRSVRLHDLVAVARGKHPIHSELGREDPQRRWYCVLRRGRVGRRQVLQARGNQILIHNGEVRANEQRHGESCRRVSEIVAVILDPLHPSSDIRRPILPRGGAVR